MTQGTFIMPETCKNTVFSSDYDKEGLRRPSPSIAIHRRPSPSIASLMTHSGSLPLRPPLLRNKRESRVESRGPRGEVFDSTGSTILRSLRIDYSGSVLLLLLLEVCSHTLDAFGVGGFRMVLDRIACRQRTIGPNGTSSHKMKQC